LHRIGARSEDSKSSSAAAMLRNVINAEMQREGREKVEEP
jgi:hypothetical protein